MSLTTRPLAPGLAALIATAALSAADTNAVVRTVSADLQQANGPLNTMFKRCVGAGPTGISARPRNSPKTRSPKSNPKTTARP